MVRAALVGYGNDAGVRSVVIQIGTGVIGLKGVILGLVRQGSSILAVLFGYLDVVVTGDSELALGRDTGNRQLNRAAAGKGIRSGGNGDRGSGLDDIKCGRADDRIANLNGSGRRTDVGIVIIFDCKSQSNF